MELLKQIYLIYIINKLYAISKVIYKIINDNLTEDKLFRNTTKIKKNDFKSIKSLSIFGFERGKKRNGYWGVKYKRATDTIFEKLKPLLNDEAVNLKIYNDYDFSYKVFPIMDDIIFDGYFQSPKYFENEYYEICKILNLYEKRQEIKTKWYLYENTISLHFRIGDYKNCQSHHPLLSDKYYIDALQYIINIIPDKTWNILYTCEKEDDEIVLRRQHNP